MDSKNAFNTRKKRKLSTEAKTQPSSSSSFSEMQRVLICYKPMELMTFLFFVTVSTVKS